MLSSQLTQEEEKKEEEESKDEEVEADPQLLILIEQAECFMKLNQFPELLKVAQDAAEMNFGTQYALKC